MIERQMYPDEYDGYSLLDHKWFARRDSRDEGDSSSLENDIIGLCLNTEFCAQTGLSYRDILELDFPTYTKLRDQMLSVMDKKAKKQDEIKRETEKFSARV